MNTGLRAVPAQILTPAPAHVRLGWKLPVRVPATVAQERMDRRINEWAVAAEEVIAIGGADEESGIVAPVTILKGTQGLGKSASVRRLIKRIRRKYPNARGLYCTQTIELGDEIASRLIEDGMPDVFVYRGRGQVRPGSDETMCAKPKEAAIVAALGFPVATTLCRQKQADGSFKECPFAATCAYLAQTEQAKLPGLIIAAQTYLSIPVEVLKNVDYVIIDESFWQTMISTKRVDFGRFTTHRAVGKLFKGNRQKVEEANFEIGNAIEDVKAIAALAQKEARPIRISDFRAVGWTTEYCNYLIGLERTRISDDLGIKADQTTAEQAAILKDADAQEGLGFIRVWKSIGAELATNRDGEFNSLQIVYGHRHPETGEKQNVILCHYRRKSQFENKPTLIIDANADLHIIRKFYPQAAFFRIEAEWSEAVRFDQSYDWEGSMEALKSEGNRDDVWNAGVFMAKRHRAQIAAAPRDANGNPLEDRRPLIVSTKSTIDSFRESGGTQQAGFDSEHMGNTRGKDGWKHSVGGGVVGRIQPATNGLEDMTRCLMADSEEEIARVVPDENGRNPLPRCAWELVAKDGTRRMVEVSFHPFWLAHRILLQIREAEVMQCLARFRPIWRPKSNPCEVFALTNIPLPIMPDRLWKKKQIIPDSHDKAWLAGAVFELAQDNVDAYPDMWKSKGAFRVETHRREERCYPVTDGSHGPQAGRYNQLIISNKADVTGLRVSFDRSSLGNRGGSVWVELMEGDTRESIIERVKSFLPDAEDFSFIMPEPEAIEAANDNRPPFVRFVSKATLRLAQNSGYEAPWWTFCPPVQPPAPIYLKRRAA